MTYQNDVFKTVVSQWKNNSQDNMIKINDICVNELINALRNSKDVYEKETSIENVYSFNFKRDVFFSGKWTELSKIARGLFINVKSNEVVARGYNKFFNINEGHFNSIDWLHDNLKYPVTAYEKYNGFLGLLGYDSASNQAIFCSKSSTSSDFAKWFEDIFNKQYTENKNELLNFLYKENYSLIFEVIDIVNDPHIIEYKENQIILLGAIKRSTDFKQASYDELCKIAKKFNFKVKQIAHVFNNFDELNEFINNEQNNYEYQHEGYVFEDANEYMFKLKGKFYKFWKQLRSVKDRIARGTNIQYGWCQDAQMTNVIGWMLKQSKELLQKNIIYIRNKYLNE